MGSFGLAGLDRLLCFMIVKELQTFQGMCTRLLNNAKDRQYHDLLDSFSKSLGNVKAVVGQYVVDQLYLFPNLMNDGCLFTCITSYRTILPHYTGQPGKLYPAMMSKMTRVWPSFLDIILKVIYRKVDDASCDMVFREAL